MVEAQPFARPPPRGREAYAASPSSSCPWSSGSDFSARSSFRIVPTRISQMRCSVSVFLLGVFPAAELAFYLDMCAFGQRLSEF